jgi:hypothetical protein
MMLHTRTRQIAQARFISKREVERSPKGSDFSKPDMPEPETASFSRKRAKSPTGQEIHPWRSLRLVCEVVVFFRKAQGFRLRVAYDSGLWNGRFLDAKGGTEDGHLDQISIT